jgi:hypothetical protein
MVQNVAPHGYRVSCIMCNGQNVRVATGTGSAAMLKAQYGTVAPGTGSSSVATVGMRH